MILQKMTAASVLTIVAAKQGPVSAAGDVLCYWMLYAMIFTGIS